MPKNKYNIGDIVQTDNGKILEVRGISASISEGEWKCYYSGYLRLPPEDPHLVDPEWCPIIDESKLKPYKKKIRKYQWAVHVRGISCYTLVQRLMTEQEAKRKFRSKLVKIESVFIDVEE